jgi:hypothetical protein
MCELCGNDSDEHPPGCCNYANLVRMALGGESLAAPDPLTMGVRPAPSVPVDFAHVEPVAARQANRKS